MQETGVETDLSSKSSHKVLPKDHAVQKFFLLMAYGTKNSCGFHYMFFSLNFLEKAKYTDLLIMFIFLRWINSWN